MAQHEFASVYTARQTCLNNNADMATIPDKDTEKAICKKYLVEKVRKYDSAMILGSMSHGLMSGYRNS